MPHIGNFPAVGYPKPLAISPPFAMPGSNAYDWEINQVKAANASSIEPQSFYLPVCLPQGARVTKLTLYGYRLAAGDMLAANLRRNDRAGGFDTMAMVNAIWIGGYGSGDDDTIDNAVIDNENYDYCLLVTIDPSLDALNCFFSGAIIDWK